MQLINKRSVVLALLFVATIGSASAQLLWQISGRGIETSYLFGTNHMVDATILDEVSGIFKAFNASRQVVGEIAVDDPELIDKTMSAIQMPSGSSYKELLADDDYRVVDSAMQAVLHMSLSDVGRLKPAILMNMYEMAIYSSYYPNKDDWQLDSYFQQVASEKDMPVRALESADEQIDLLVGKQSLTRQAFLLVGSVRQSSAVKGDEFERVNRFYRAGALDSLLNDYIVDNSEYALTLREKHQLLDERNQVWVPKLVEFMRQRPTFIAVGALHLPGENGLIALLRKAGYKVKPVQ